MSETPVIQIIEKEKYFNQHIVSLPDGVPSAPLATPSSVRVRTKVLGLTVNNLTYVKLGFLLGWWDVHPTPSNVPAPYNDTEKYGRTNCWGFAEVLESTLPSVPEGSFLWGYLPLGTLAQDLTVEEAENPGQVIVTNDYRKNIMSIYNRYTVYPASFREQIEKKTDAVASEAILRVMFETSYLLNRFALAENPEQLVNPATDPSTPWGKEHADLTGATIIVLAPGSKVGVAYAFEAKHGREIVRASRVIGAASEHSKKFVEDTGLYDVVVSTSDSPQETLSRLGVGHDEKIVLVDFGGRGNSRSTWVSEIKKTHTNLIVLGLGADIPGSTKEDVLKAMAQADKDSEAIIPNASVMRARAVAIAGEKQYFQDLTAGWEDFRSAGGVKGLSYKWGSGMEDVKQGWDTLCSGDSPSNEALVYLL